MKKVLIAALLILSVVAVNAKESDTKTKTVDSEAVVMLSGSIADELSGESLVGVEVKIEGTDLKTYTDFDGNFSFKNVKPGEYKLVANYISYEKKSEVLKIETNENDIKIELQTSN
uniref:carboxypeptidase-like regulatory domain-containing protein n=1 Tax=uncultured Draconibacterium sp. TaxID=1573823 RepID=UPI003216898B